MPRRPWHAQAAEPRKGRLGTSTRGMGGSRNRRAKAGWEQQPNSRPRARPRVAIDGQLGSALKPHVGSQPGMVARRLLALSSPRARARSSSGLLWQGTSRPQQAWDDRPAWPGRIGHPRKNSRRSSTLCKKAMDVLVPVGWALRNNWEACRLGPASECQNPLRVSGSRSKFCATSRRTPIGRMKSQTQVALARTIELGLCRLGCMGRPVTKRQLLKDAMLFGLLPSQSRLRLAWRRYFVLEQQAAWRRALPRFRRRCGQPGTTRAQGSLSSSGPTGAGHCLTMGLP